IVIGTTGLSADQETVILSTARKIPIVLSPNMSVGVNTLFKLAADAAKILGAGYDLEILEAHHRQKKDAPSGTAVKIAEILAAATSRRYPQDVNFHRQGMTGERDPREIGMQVIRGGDIVGEHTVFYCGAGERLEIRHVATSRSTFADGALRAAKWIVGQKPGLYTMGDVLGL
ncbi:MAG: 4-hydroxy-tetrahydrodipicolinate reductase, partial [Chlamydiae bacterium RIFCSPHIGHO2_12_FULL_49_11]